VLITAFCYFLFDYTRVGKVCKLIGENANAVRFTGINPVPFVIFGHVLLGLFVGIGSFMVSPRFSIVPSTAGAGLELDVMIACMIGGLPLTGGMDSKVSRPIIGSIIIGVLNQGYALLNAPSSVIQVTKGILFIVIIIITTPGALDTINSFAGRERRPNVIKENA
jgi:ribose transport system permease protein